MSSTPIRSNSIRPDSTQFSPITCARSPASISPQKNLTGPARIVRDISADLFNNIQKWNDMHIKGALVIKQLGLLDDGSRPVASEPIVNELYEIVQNLLKTCDCFDILSKQITATSKLNRSATDNETPLFASLSTKSIAKLIDDIVTAYKNELQIKQDVLENIAYTRNKADLMFLAACWTYQCCIKSDIKLKLETLLTETGHRTIN